MKEKMRNITSFEAMVEAGLRNKVKVMVGSGLVDEKVCMFTGADGWGDDAIKAVDLCRRFIDEV